MTAPIPIKSIRPGLNYRSTPGDVAGLAKSIGRLGVLQPIIVAELPEGGWQVVAGNRRLAAAQIAGLDEIPAVVLAGGLDRTSVQLAENAAREDAHPLDEADAFARLAEEGAELADIAAAVARPESFVRRRLKLAALGMVVRQALRDGRISVAVADQIARIDRPSDQEEALALVEGRATSAAEAWRIIDARLVRRLSAAPFSLSRRYADIDPCKACPKRTSVQADLFGEIEGDDRCLDPRCFSRKIELHWEAEKAAAEEAGREILSAEEAGQVFLGWTDAPSPRSGYVLSTDRHWADPEGRTWGDLLGADQPWILARTPRGRAVRLYRRDVAEEAAAAHEEVPVEAPSKVRARAAETRAAGREVGKAAEELRKRIVASASERGLELAAWEIVLRDALDRARLSGAAAKRAEAYRADLHANGPGGLFELQAAILDLALSARVKACVALGELDPALVALGRLYGAEVGHGEE